LAQRNMPTLTMYTITLQCQQQFRSGTDLIPLVILSLLGKPLQKKPKVSNRIWMKLAGMFFK